MVISLCRLQHPATDANLWTCKLIKQFQKLVLPILKYIDNKGLRRNALLHQLLQALIELADVGSDERALLESISNHVAAKSGTDQLSLPLNN